MSAPAPEAETNNGALAQLGERLLCKHQVIGSIPIGSTIFADAKMDCLFAPQAPGAGIRPLGSRQ